MTLVHVVNRAIAILAGFVFLGLAFFGCAFAPAPMAAGSSTPSRRTDVAAGASLRVPRGELRSGVPGSGSLHASSSGPGPAPLALVRYGLGEHGDIEAGATGTHLRLGGRKEWVMGPIGTMQQAVLFGAIVMVGRVYDVGLASGPSGDGGWRFGMDVPAVYAIEIGSLYEVWAGGRIGFDRVVGEFVPSGASMPENGHATGLRAGPVIGLAVGHRHFHALIEFTAAYEVWRVDLGARSTRSGWVLIPAFAFRVRI